MSFPLDGTGHREAARSLLDDPNVRPEIALLAHAFLVRNSSEDSSIPRFSRRALADAVTAFDAGGAPVVVQAAHDGGVYLDGEMSGLHFPLTFEGYGEFGKLVAALIGHYDRMRKHLNSPLEPKP